MENFDSDDTLLARWLSGDLSEEELASLKQREDFADFERIARVSNQFKAPHFDADKNWQGIQHRIQPGSTKNTSSKWPYLAIAAGIALLLGFFAFFQSESLETYTTLAEQKNIELPDGSTIVMNAGTSISYNKDNWDEKRLVEMDGEAFFDVKDGAQFEVNTPLGNVEVLGTTFNIHQRAKTFIVSCYSGMVGVNLESRKNAEVLSAGQTARFEGSKLISQTTLDATHESPSWTRGESSFEDVTLLEVVAELERQYGIEVIKNDTDLSKKYTGVFPHRKLDVALKLVFEPMGLNFEVDTVNKAVTLTNP